MPMLFLLNNVSCRRSTKAETATVKQIKRFANPEFLTISYFHLRFLCFGTLQKCESRDQCLNKRSENFDKLKPVVVKIKNHRS